MCTGERSGACVTRAESQDAASFCASEFPNLVRGLSLYVGDVHTAEELAQEALLRACQHWGRVSELESPGGWVWRVAVNLANSGFRRRQAERRATNRLAHAPVHGDDSDTAVSLVLRSAIRELPDRQRLAVVLRFVMDLSIEQTAERMAVSSDAVRSLTKRATATLRGRLSTQSDVVTEVHDG